MLQSVGIQSGLSDLLLKRASRYTPDPVEQTRLADRTIAAALNGIDVIEQPCPREALYSVMHRLVRDVGLNDRAGSRRSAPHIAAG